MMASNDVDSIISQAMDQIALEQIVSLNTVHLSDADILPTSLESRFRTLKSLPKPTPIPKSETQDQEFHDIICKDEQTSSPNPSDEKSTPPIHPSLAPTLPRRGSGLDSSPADLSPKGQGLCCFGFLLQTRKAKNDEKGRVEIGDGGGWMEEDRLGNRETLSILKEQRRKMKKVMEEQDKVCREAEKLFELVKQQSSVRFDEFLSDDDEDATYLGFR
ncbi:hypothetical protein ZOSMA_31G00390 [Zostera marina]|uniref:Uncharacterized protein n=1 Tax=Zostera marina TaxID=29655 RepID=A0A0K9P8R4_ZOSMR|nr:hypothetical protein ZOSMA_31G00390 [Zostera marina]